MSLAIYIIKRILISIPVILLISIIAFALIQLPPGDALTAMAAAIATSGGGFVSEAQLESLRDNYGLDQPVWVQYWRWVRGFPKGDFGIAISFSAAPVKDLLGERILLTIILNLLALLFALSVAVPVGLYSATHKYTLADYFLTFIAFIGISIPGFILAVLIIIISLFWLDTTYLGGLFSLRYIDASWSLGRIVDFIKHLPAPVIAIGVAQTSNTMRIMRGNTLDVLNMPFIQTARAKGLNELRVQWKHVARVSINPIISRVGVNLPEIIATEMMVSIVLNLKTLGPLFYKALVNQDMYLAGTIILILAVILIVGNLIADIVLAWLDPRIRMELS